MRNLVGSGVLVFTALACFYLFCVHYTDQYHCAIVRNMLTGKLRCDIGNGVHFTAPWYQAARVDIRPARVCITTTARTFNCRLAKFEPAAYEKFVKVQGFRYYWWANRISFNLGYSEEYRGMKDIMRGYAFSVEQYPFLKVLKDYSEP